MIKQVAPVETDFEKVLDQKMIKLLGKRQWNVWRTDIEPEMYNAISLAMLDYGEKVRKNTKKEIIGLIKKSSSMLRVERK